VEEKNCVEGLFSRNGINGRNVFLWMGLVHVFRSSEQTSNPDSRLRNYKLHFSSQILRDQQKTGKKEKKRKHLAKEREDMRTYME